MEFNTNHYYESAKSGYVCEDISILEYIKSFSRIILWGASFQGQAIGKKLHQYKINVYCYWDLRYDEIGKVNEIHVVAPFSTDDKENTLVIICIGNRVIQKSLIADMKRHGYSSYIKGDYLYMGLICPFDIKTGINARRCSGTMECRQIYCERIEGILRAKVDKEDCFFLPSVTLIVNQRCSLKCKYCTSYMNEYIPQERINFSVEQIFNDIDKFFNAVDGVGTITVMGGEPFLHPELSEIVAHLCEWKNFGLISVATSGTCVIKEAQLKGLHDERVNVSFSNYTDSINATQRQLFYKNIELVKDNNVQYTVGLFSPEWVIPSTLDNKHYTDEIIAHRKQSLCTHWHQIKNGKVHPCDFAQSLYCLHIADYPTDYVDLNKAVSRDELRQELKEYHERAFYESCRHHIRDKDKKVLMTAKAAEQGYVNLRGDI